jgi:GNAT superfamily N-acetyltransferase
MAHRSPIPLTPVLIGLGSREFEAISGWPFADPFVARLLREDIPQRVQFGNCQIWIYRDPDGRLVGFGTLDVCDECREYTEGKLHPYIPLLAVNPTIKSLGYGTSILRHLIDESTLLAFQGVCHDVLFLDVYTASEKAIRLYY